MLDAPIPDDDELRIADLCALEVLDTAPEWRFDRITQAAQRLFNVPIALVSLVDRERQWFNSRTGLEATETPRNISFCGHAIHHDYPFIIPNATQDVRFADNPLVAGDFHLRFYAGMPLRSRQGRRLGTLCLIDREPRELSGSEITLLTDLGAWAERELNLRELQEASDAAEQSARQLRNVLDSATDAIISIDEGLKITTFNRSAEQMFGVRSDEQTDKTLCRLLPAKAIRHVRESMATLMVNHQLHMVLPRDLELLSTDGTLFSADIQISRADIQQQTRFTLIIRDVTAQRELDAMKSEFVATVSHELRTPATSIKGAVKLLLSMANTLSGSQLKLLDIADKNCERLSQMINDILDLERMHGGKLQMNPTTQTISPWVKNALTTMQTYADSFGVPISLEHSASDAETMCSIDEGRITQVIVNLLSNAISFSPKGSPVRARIERVGDHVRVSVIDQGSGISEEFRKRIFKRFAQATAGNVRGQAGSGLGLSICKAIIEQHHGEMGFHSEPSRGSTFYFDLPATVPA